MDQSITHNHYRDLRQAVDQRAEMGLNIIPTTEHIVLRDQFQGNLKWKHLRDIDGLEDLAPIEYNLGSLPVHGRWNHNDQVFRGCFACRIKEDGECYVPNKRISLAPEEIHHQIDLAEEFQIDLGIAAEAVNFLGGSPYANAIIYGDHKVIHSLGTQHPILIETHGGKAWTYAKVNYESEDSIGYFNWRTSEVFGITDTNLTAGTITRNGIALCFPSIFNGERVKAECSGKETQILFIPSAAQIGIYLEGTECTIHTGQEDENLQWSHTPEEDEDLFEQSVNKLKASLKPKPPIKRQKTIDTSTNNTHAMDESATGDESLADVLDINLFDYLPQKLANALQLIREPLPYDARTVLVSFMTGAASMLRLGTTVTGNELSNYTVPINCYTILVAKSGRKKTPLQRFFVREPASDVLLQVAQQNERMVKTWKGECQGKNNNDRPPRPVAVDIRINDYTGEAFVQALGKLDEVGRAVLIVRDEIAALFATLNSYRAGKGSDEQQLLELYDGDGYRSLRVGDTGRAYSRAAVNIYGAIQPQVLEKLLKDGDANGMWARFSFTALPDMTKKLPTESSPEQLMERAAAEKYLKDFISRIYELPAIKYKLDEEAMELFSEYEYKKQKDAQTTKVSAQAAMYGKSAGKVLRYAGLLHILDYVGNEAMAEHSIPISRLQDAIQLVDDQDSWTLDCHAKIAGISSPSFSPFERRMHELALKEKVAVKWTTIRDAMSSKEKHNKTINDAEKAANKFVALGLGEASNGPNGGLMYKALKPLPN